MQQERQFGSWSLAAAGGTVLVVQNFHPVMLIALRSGEMGTWLAMLGAGLLALALFWPVASCISRLSGGNLIDLARAAAGRPGAIVTGTLVCGLLVFHSGVVLRQSAEMAVSSLYPHTPQIFAVVSFIICVFYGAYGGMAALVRLCRILLPVLILSILLILVGAFGWGQMRYLLPLWGPGPAALLGSSVLLTATLSPVLFLLMAAGQLSDRARLGRAGFAVIVGAAVMFALTTAVLVMTYPIPMATNVAFPLHAMSRLVLGGRFFERIEAIWLFVWVLGTAAHLSALIHVAASAYTQAFGAPTHRPAVLPLVSIMLVIAFFPHDEAQAIAWYGIWTLPALLIGFGLPLALAVLATWRQRMGHRVA